MLVRVYYTPFPTRKNKVFFDMETKTLEKKAFFCAVVLPVSCAGATAQKSGGGWACVLQAPLAAALRSALPPSWEKPIFSSWFPLYWP